MRNFKCFIINAGILTVTSLILQLAGVAFNVYISSALGAAGMGLLQLIMSVYRFAVTFSLTGIGLTSTRLVSEELARGSFSGVSRATRNCLVYSAIFGAASSLILFLCGDYIGTALLGDTRCISSIYIMALGMPFISMTCVLSGYFTAVRRIGKSAAVQIFEQFLHITLVMYLLKYFAPKGLEFACIAITAGGAFSEITSFICIYTLYYFDKKRYTDKKIFKAKNLTKKMLQIALPVGFGSHLRSGLGFIQQIMIPSGLTRHGGSRSGALAKYGIIQGMVMPVIMFPCVFLTAFSNMIIPELAACRTKKNGNKITYIVSNVFKTTLLFSICMSGIMLSLADCIALTVFKNPDVSVFIKIFAPLATAMYLDNAVDGMLKGLDQQVSSMRYNIIDSAVSIFLVCTVIPKLGIHGYILVIFTSELLNTSLSAARLIKVTDFKIRIADWILKPVIAIASANLILHTFIPLSAGYVSLIFYILFTALIYLALLAVMGVSLTPHKLAD